MFSNMYSLSLSVVPTNFAPAVLNDDGRPLLLFGLAVMHRAGRTTATETMMMAMMSPKEELVCLFAAACLPSYPT